MKNTLTTFVAVLGIFGASFAGAQDKMQGHMQGHDMMSGHKMQGHMMGHMMGGMPMSTMMMGLSADEKKVAQHMMSKMSSQEKAAMAKRCQMCMVDKHAGMMEKMGKMDKMAMHKAAMDHMMSGMSKGDQMTMKKMMGRMSKKEMEVSMKMMENCCMYGMKHGK